MAETQVLRATRRPTTARHLRPVTTHRLPRHRTMANPEANREANRAAVTVRLPLPPARRKATARPRPATRNRDMAGNLAVRYHRRSASVMHSTGRGTDLR